MTGVPRRRHLLSGGSELNKTKRGTKRFPFRVSVSAGGNNAECYQTGQRNKVRQRRATMSGISGAGVGNDSSLRNT